MSGSRWFALALLAVSPLALADSIYACKGSDGSVVYRDFPCPADSESSTVVSGPKAGAAGAKAPSNRESELRAGMSKSEVRAILGSPTEITQEEGVDGRVDTWSYSSGSKPLQFDSTGRLIK
jgi:outer membrane protein assembly factor BamE (lipoprotein component of BamABCDE complex)